MVCATLSQSGYTCLEAADGTEALRMLAGGRKVELVLTDVIMPKMGGRELAQHLARIKPELRVIFMSGYAEEPLDGGPHEMPLEFLAKPFTASVLTETVRRVLDR
jgi:CheY-like chemotaxis protein